MINSRLKITSVLIRTKFVFYSKRRLSRRNIQQGERRLMRRIPETKYLLIRATGVTRITEPLLKLNIPKDFAFCSAESNAALNLTDGVRAKI